MNLIETLEKEEADRLLAKRSIPLFEPGDTTALICVDVPEVPETEASFEGNALLKAAAEGPERRQHVLELAHERLVGQRFAAIGILGFAHGPAFMMTEFRLCRRMRTTKRRKCSGMSPSA